MQGSATTVKPGQMLARIASPDFGEAQADARKAESDLALARKNARAACATSSRTGWSRRKDLQAAEAEFARAQAEARARASRA